MSLEAFYQSLPMASQLLERSIQDEGYGQFLVTRFRFLPGKPHPMWQGEDLEFCQDLNAMLVQHPGLQTRNLRLGTCWDLMEYLLSPARRAELLEQTCLGRQAIRGELELAPHLCCTQGVPIRINPPETVLKIRTYLNETDFWASLDPNSMRQAEIYKNLSDLSDQKYRALVEDLLAKLTAFYEAAAGHNEAVLVWRD